MKKLNQDSTECPHCGASLVGDPIPEESKEWYGNRTHYSLVIAITIQGFDYTSAYACPYCEKVDDREW